MKIGVFDSGVGGQAMAQAIAAKLPELEIVVREDSQHVPYGTRSPDEVFGFVVPIFESMIDNGCRVIVVACNTVTTTLIDRLRERFDVPLVAVEPMVKPAAEQSQSRVIAVCATPMTLLSPRYLELKQTYAAELTVIEPDCSDWAFMIESQQIDHQKITERINEVLDQKADIIVLACTHYHWIEEEIRRLAASKAKVLQPEQAIIRQLERVLAQLD